MFMASEPSMAKEESIMGKPIFVRRKKESFECKTDSTLIPGHALAACVVCAAARSLTLSLRSPPMVDYIWGLEVKP